VQNRLLDKNVNLDEFMNLVVNEMLTLTPATGSVIELADNGDMVYRAATGTVQEYIGLRLALKSSISGLCVQSHQVLICIDTEKDTRVNVEACRRVKARSLVVAPLFNDNKAVGVLKIISDKPDAFSDADVKVLQIMAGFLGSALATKMLDELRNFF
jgi:putative methionine-R-sulfoxide reductase with GAF domain